MNEGYLYIAINEAFPNWVKVGSTKDIKKRIHTYQTSDPHRKYKIVFSLRHPQYKKAEKKVRELMKPFAKSIKNEWFEINVDMAIPRLEESLDEYNNSPSLLI